MSNEKILCRIYIDDAGIKIEMKELDLSEALSLYLHLDLAKNKLLKQFKDNMDYEFTSGDIK